MKIYRVADPNPKPQKNKPGTGNTGPRTKYSYPCRKNKHSACTARSCECTCHDEEVVDKRHGLPCRQWGCECNVEE